jgi:hypothetical protein
MTKTAPYWLLLTREPSGWCIVFGTYDRDAVLAERNDYRDEYRACDLHILRVDSSSQAAIDAAVLAYREAQSFLR